MNSGFWPFIGYRVPRAWIKASGALEFAIVRTTESPLNPPILMLLANYFVTS